LRVDDNRAQCGSAAPDLVLSRLGTATGEDVDGLGFQP
jgi:hypothetical protein